ncbi:hypothetical protein Si103_00748 [Streptococcus infantarius subsp. infantarius]|nr:hypothetical protein [Streptococcus infantarius subsp. infantarius]MCO4551833.1 hypothetical protein [Streptococcus infantarius subsp. infantarius]MCO4564827.1 hypothetical protein [Streptococcus infantarius subsp. infantarius]DAI62404.1 MAG TPA: Protein of unknown function (DUF1056) [Caudoviricetes sp.]
MKWFLNNIHTVLLILGLGLIAYSAFLYSLILGYLIGGFLLVALAVIINNSADNRK